MGLSIPLTLKQTVFACTKRNPAKLTEKSDLNEALKEISGKEKTPYLKVNYKSWVYPPLFGINQDRLEISIKTSHNKQ